MISPQSPSFKPSDLLPPRLSIVLHCLITKSAAEFVGLIYGCHLIRSSPYRLEFVFLHKYQLFNMPRSNPKVLSIPIAGLRTLGVFLDIVLLALAIVAHTQGEGNVITYIAVSNRVDLAVAEVVGILIGGLVLLLIPHEPV